jgi:hypothetical protein
VKPQTASPLRLEAAGGLERAVKLVRPNLAYIGWELRHVDVDLVLRRIDMRAQRYDGRWIHLRVTPSYAVLERWQRSDAPQHPVGKELNFGPAGDHFLGRTRVSGMADAIRTFGAYLVDNSPRQLPGGSANFALLGRWVNRALGEPQ